MSFFKMPATMINIIKKIQRQFLWGWESLGKKITRLAWDKVCKPRSQGSLGVIDIRTFNL